MSITGTPNWALTVKELPCQLRARPLSGNSQQSVGGPLAEAVRHAHVPSRGVRALSIKVTADAAKPIKIHVTNSMNELRKVS
jgi:hypothetical protein